MADPPPLAARGLTVRLGGRPVLREVDLSIGADEVVAVVGPNGSGKSTLLRCLYGAQGPDGGMVALHGRPLGSWSRREVARHVAIVAQDPPPSLPLTVEDMVLLGRLPHRRGVAGWTEEDRQVAGEAIDACGIGHLVGRAAWTLSGGERQRVLIARALAQRAPLVLWDEPTNHLDLRHAHQGLALLRGRGLAGMVVLHDLNLAARHADRVVVLQHGRVVDDGPPRRVLTAGLVAEVFGVRATTVDDEGAVQLLLRP